MSMPGVVYLASWPRSGNTLLRAILWQCFGLETCSMYSEESMHARNPDWHKLTGAIPFPNRMKDVQEIIDRQGVALFKTHNRPDEPDNPVPMSYEGFGSSIPIRTIYLIRDGREACISYWHYLREIPKLDMTLEQIIRGDYPFGGWSAHVQAWKPMTRLNTLCLRFEDAIHERASVVVTLEHILRMSATRYNIVPWREFRNSDPAFFRSATNDTWKMELTGDDLALFNELHGDTMREYGYYPVRAAEHADCTV